jgi:hypothetical protein
LAIQGIQLDADNDVTPQLIFLSGLSCAATPRGEVVSPTTNASKKTLLDDFIFILFSPSPDYCLLPDPVAARALQQPIA